MDATFAPPSSKLSAIDTLMQSRPDSALKAMYSCTDTSIVSASDRHYYQLLLSEALYKNDFAQQNRPELLDAMAYFDSIGDAFLSARCHHMNGVGYYEMDSVVAACAEYMKAVEIMESHFEERDLMEYKAKFMALAYTHLSVLFSDQYLHEQAIYFGKCALLYYNRYDAEPWHVAWVLDEIGMHHDMMEQWDSAWTYYSKGLELLNDTSCLMYRDIVTHIAYLSYCKEKKESSIKQLHNLLARVESEKEYLARCLIIGEIYYDEGVLDSAYYYLNIVFNTMERSDPKIISAQRLQDICWKMGDSLSFNHYTLYLSRHAHTSDLNAPIHSQLIKLSSVFLQKTHERQHQQDIKKEIKRIILIFVGCVLALMIITIYQKQRKAKEQPSSEKWDGLKQFLNEPVCQDIILSIQGKNIKRSAVPMDYPELILSEAQLQQFALTVNRYFGSFDSQLERHGLNSNTVLVNLCHLYLLGMDEKQSSILLNRDYSSIKRYEKKLKTAFNTQKDMVTYMRNMLLNN